MYCFFFFWPQLFLGGSECFFWRLPLFGGGGMHLSLIVSSFFLLDDRKSIFVLLLFAQEEAMDACTLLGKRSQIVGGLERAIAQN